MKLAETVRTRWVLALVSVAFGASAIVAATQMCTKSPAQAVVKKTPPSPMRGCHQRKVVQPRNPDYRAVLATARPAFAACTENQPEGVFYEIRLPINGAGRVTSVEVRGKSSDLSKVSMKVVKCLEQAAAPLQFPPTGSDAVVSTGLMTP